MQIKTIVYAVHSDVLTFTVLHIAKHHMCWGWTPSISHYVTIITFTFEFLKRSAFNILHHFFKSLNSWTNTTMGFQWFQIQCLVHLTYFVLTLLH